MRILVTGANGQLGNELRFLSQHYKEFEFIYTDVAELDITSAAAVNSFFKNNQPIDVVINCAAYTAVDKSESNEQAARLLNADSAGILASAAKNGNVKLIHFSTDFVFDGNKSTPYCEDDKTAPLSVYGKTKLEGEQAVLKSGGDVTIIRTAWLYSQYGSNFVKTIMRIARELGKLTVIFDQVGAPTYARDLANAVLKILPQLKAGKQNIYHYSNEGVASWYDFAIAICEFAGIDCEITPIEAKDYPAAAKRPAYSVFNKAKFKKDFGIIIPYWRNSLKECIEIIKDNERQEK